MEGIQLFVKVRGYSRWISLTDTELEKVLQKGGGVCQRENISGRLS